MAARVPEVAPRDASWNFGEIEERGVFPDEKRHGWIGTRDELVRYEDCTDELMGCYMMINDENKERGLGVAREN